jgi:hypothetical protein
MLAKGIARTLFAGALFWRLDSGPDFNRHASGSVADYNGRGCAEVSVELKNGATGATVITLTGSEGLFRFNSLAHRDLFFDHQTRRGVQDLHTVEYQRHGKRGSRPGKITLAVVFAD